jgi:integrase
MTDPYYDHIRGADISDKTKESYINAIKAVQKLMTTSSGKTPPLSWIVCNPVPVIKKMNVVYTNVRTKKTMLSAIKALFKHVRGLKEKSPECYAKWDGAYRKVETVAMDQMLSGEPTAREKQNWVPWEEVRAMEIALADSQYGSFDHLLLAMYCLIEPLRQNFGDVKLCKKDLGCDDKNFLILPKGVLVLNKYKTARRYGRYERELPGPLMDIIHESLRQYPREHLFVGSDGGPYTSQNGFTQFSNKTLRRIFGKRFTVSMMRHSFISGLDFNREVPASLFEKAKNMAHSLTTQQMYRRKVQAEEVQPVTKIIVIKECA